MAVFRRKKKAKEVMPPPKVEEGTSLFMDIVDLIADLAKVVEDVRRLYRRFRGRKETRQ